MGVYENLMDVFGRLRAIPGSFNFAWIIIEIYEKKKPAKYTTHTTIIHGGKVRYFLLYFCLISNSQIAEKFIQSLQKKNSILIFTTFVATCDAALVVFARYVTLQYFLQLPVTVKVCGMACGMSCGMAQL